MGVGAANLAACGEEEEEEEGEGTDMSAKRETDRGWSWFSK